MDSNSSCFWLDSNRVFFCFVFCLFVVVVVVVLLLLFFLLFFFFFFFWGGGGGRLKFELLCFGGLKLELCLVGLKLGLVFDWTESETRLVFGWTEIRVVFG